MDPINRRSLLKGSALAAPVFFLRGLRSSPLSRVFGNACAPTAPTNRKLVVFFLRGGCDGVNLAIPGPNLDSTYTATRGALALPFSGSGRAIALTGSNFFVHPSLLKLRTSFEAGRAAFLHRIGNATSDRSHFKEMQIYETGKPGTTLDLIREGWATRLALAFQNQPVIGGASFSKKLQQLFRATPTSFLMPNLKTVYGDVNGASRDLVFAIDSSGAPPPEISNLSNRWASHFGTTSTVDTVADTLVRGSGDKLFDVIGDLATNLPNPIIHDEAAFPVDPNNIPPQGTEMMANLESAMHVLKHTDCQVAGLELGGFDTHQNHYSGLPHEGAYANLLTIVSHAMYHADQWAISNDAGNEYLFLAITEFGRTIAPNSTAGLDHGVGSCFIAVGHGVKSGVYNGTNSTSKPKDFGQAWDPIASQVNDPTYPDALTPKSDFRVVFAEILEKHFNLPRVGAGVTVDSVLPGYGGTIGTTPFDSLLDFLV
ncbi:MAG: DUF1501 domain-containing protein [Planctomycetes bacterium]|nr:DUF1501 domain-containing protein [Planctomycetota bacterium]